VVAKFHALHARSYGYADEQRPVEIVTLRVQAVARTPKPRQAAAKIVRGNAAGARIATHRIFEQGKWQEGSLYDRARLRPGHRFSGPAVIIELSATTYLPRGWTANVDRFGNLVLAPTTSSTRRGGRR
jgi:N-methylhydantoinase A